MVVIAVQAITGTKDYRDLVTLDGIKKLEMDVDDPEKLVDAFEAKYPGFNAATYFFMKNGRFIDYSDGLFS